MSVSSHSDFYKFNWHVVLHQSGVTIKTIFRILFLCLISFIIFVSIYLINSIVGSGSNVFLWLMSGFSFLTLATIGYFWIKMATKAEMVKIIYYSIDYQGLKVGNQLYSFSEFNLEDIEDVQQYPDEFTHTDNNLINLSLPVNHKRQQVWFNSEADLNKFLKSLLAYLQK